VGVTGHQDLVADPRLEHVIREQIRRIRAHVPSADTEVRLAVVSQLADGADRLLVRIVRKEAQEQGEDWRLEAILPFDRSDYPKWQEFSEESREKFETLLAGATSVSEPASAEPPQDRAAAYESASRQVVGRSDVLIALWDGGPSGGRGGTAETLLHAAARSKPCIWVSTEGEPAVRDNLENGSSRAFFREVERRAAASEEPDRNPADHAPGVLDALRDTFWMLDEFNRERLPAGSDSDQERELDSGGGMAAWVAAPFARASVLSARWQRRFRWSSWLVFLCAMAAAATLAVSLSFGEGSTFWQWAEAAFLILALTGVFIVRRSGLHRRWLSYRVLAERLRSAHYLASTGVDFRRQARIEAVYVGDRSEDWLMRAFEEVWDRRPKVPAPDMLTARGLEQLKRHLADGWIGGQIRYHEAAARRHRRWGQILTSAVATCFIATVPFALLHAFHVAEHASTFLTITLPAAGASLGALLTINQHHALSERHARMRSDLAVVRRTVVDANADTLGKASSEAARVIAQETGAWFGAMWFLDIEHP
jgi:SMODS and SLOG-associating 2TM effector domain 1